MYREVGADGGPTCFTGSWRDVKVSEGVNAHYRDWEVMRTSLEGVGVDGHQTDGHGLSIGGSLKTVLRALLDFPYLILWSWVEAKKNPVPVPIMKKKKSLMNSLLLFIAFFPIAQLLAV